ncbi:metal-dependent hydrolase [Yoonia litorea]|uniref:UPF0173 metal-dependent hydrolase SAMN05444714_0537 n=1 Tax=Yoonia litorea TaxID=1123755 RepID=A0A1I6LHB9_9RHOB|nr:metal-dependent hydrolase [Yoonia litorea]SFS02720.1 L-ascorbate metabolism protein UlaG, beta-lactamase superfamily [Yoonia litorea]
MKITWLGHSGFRIEIEDVVLLIDPWMSGNPSFPETMRDKVLEGATHLLISHGHGDHAADALTIAKNQGIPILCIFELAEIWGGMSGIECIGFGKGGTVATGNASVSMVNASHSSSLDGNGTIKAAGSEAGFMVTGEGHRIYFTGDTDIMADMDWMGDFYNPDIGILCCGGHFTMGMEGAAYAAKRYFDFKTVIPCHYRTFPVLAQSAQPLVDALPDVDVKVPDVMETITI